MRNTEQTLAYLERERQTGSRRWPALCLALCRTARGQGPRFPSALSSQEATPKKYRIYDTKKIRAGMVAYFDDPDDSNTFGHIATVAGRDDDGHVLVYTNDAFILGGVSLVRLDWFEANWGDKFQFAATWLGGEPIPDLQPKPKPKPKNNGEAVQRAIKDVRKAIKHNRKINRPNVVNRLERDVKRLQNTLKLIQSK